MTYHERLWIRKEFTRLYGVKCYDDAMRMRKSTPWMADEIQEFKNTQARCDEIKNQTVKGD